MCGYAGFLSFHRPPAQRRSILLAMGDAISHRGPDDEQCFDDGNLAIIFRQLAITDPWGPGQPFQNEDKTLLLAANGEIYNHRSLRKTLEKSHCFQGNSDIETLLHGYEEWGEAVFQQARGMFSCVLWDARRQRLTLACDRFGIKPLYYCPLPDGLLFASELKGLLAHPDCPREVDFSRLHTPLREQAPPSFVKGISLLPGGHLSTFESEQKQRLHCYWNIQDPAIAKPIQGGPENHVEALASLLEEAVSEHLPDNGGFALFLSGGLDSSLLAALCAPQGALPVCATLVERSTLLAGDTQVAAQVSEHLKLPWLPGLVHYRSLAADLDFDLARFERQVWMMDSPRFDLEWLCKDALYGTLQQYFPELKVSLLGQGADEFCGGYSNRAGSPWHDWAGYISGDLAPWVNNVMGENRSSATLSPKAWGAIARQLQYHNLWHEDRTAAGHGMEARVPFLDHRIVEFLLGIPENLRPTLCWDKQILRLAARRLAPWLPAPERKLGLFWGEDSRSADLLTLDLASRLLPDFIDQHGRQADPRIEPLRQRIHTRQPGFYQASYELLQVMAEISFTQMITQAYSPPPLDHPCLPLVAPNAWSDLVDELSPDPLLHHTWDLAAPLLGPPGFSYQASPLGEHRHALSFSHLGQPVARIDIPSTQLWLTDLLHAIYQAEGQGVALRDCPAASKQTEEECFRALDLLAQAGVLLPQNTTPRNALEDCF